MTTAALSDIKFMTMNANGQSTAEGKKDAIFDTFIEQSPHIVFFQEFKWTDLSGPAFKKKEWPSWLKYTGHEEASIAYDERFFTDMNELPPNKIQRCLDTLGDFNPEPRMCVRLAKFLDDQQLMCVSWHGRWRGMSKKDQRNRFKDLMTFLGNLKKIYDDVPCIIAGDFNVLASEITDLVPKENFRLNCDIDFTKRRTVEKCRDYVVASSDIRFDKLKAVDLKHNKKYLDHDPIVGYMMFPLRKAERLSPPRKAKRPSPSRKVADLSGRETPRRKVRKTTEEQRHRRPTTTITIYNKDDRQWTTDTTSTKIDKKGEKPVEVCTKKNDVVVKLLKKKRRQ